MEFLLTLKTFFAHLIEWLHHNPGWAGFVTFLISLSESLAVVGLLVPGTVIMAAIGTLIGANVIPAGQTIACAIAGAIVGDSLSYRLGYHFTDHLRDIWPFKRYPQLLTKGEKFFTNHGGKSVFLGRFVGPIRPIVPVIAGMLRMQSHRFFLSNITSAFLWAPAYMLPGILIGAASLELDSKTATHFLVSVIAILISICLTAWLFQYLIMRLIRRMDKSMSKLWHKLQNKPFSQSFCRWIAKPDNPQSHSQLTLCFLSIIVLVALISLILCKLYGSGFSDINNDVYYFFRSIQSTLFTKFFIGISLLGFRFTLLPATILISVLLLLSRSTRPTAIFFLGALISTAIIISLSKLLLFSPRPNGLSGFISANSFPSGHTAASIAFYGSLAVIVYPFLSFGAKQFTAIGVCLLCLLIGISRLYLEVHWFTDIMAGILLGSLCVTVGTLFYRRYKKPTINVQQFLWIILLSLAAGWLLNMQVSFSKLTTRYTAYWPSAQMTLAQWWEQSSPIYLNSRTGKPIKLFNIQWLSSIEDIENELTKNGWESVPKLTLSSTINRLSSPDQGQRLPLAPKVFAGEKPILFMYKKLEKENVLLVLQLWRANIDLTDSKTPLWFGLIDYKLPKKNHFWRRDKYRELKKKLQPASIYTIKFLDSFKWRRVCFPDENKPSRDITHQQWEFGVLLLAPKNMELSKAPKTNCS